MLGGGIWPVRKGKRLVVGVSEDRAALLDEILQLVCAQKVRPVIQETLNFGEIRKAYEITDSGRKRGSVVLTF